MARLDPLSPEQMSPAQRALNEELFRNRKVAGPFTVWLRNLSLADAANRLTLTLRENGKADKRLFELAALMVIRFWGARYAWAAHVPPALAAGLSRETIEAIRQSRRPELKQDDERIVYETVTELLQRKVLSQAQYDKMVARFGLDLTVELVNVVGLYSFVSTTINAFDIPTPDDRDPFEGS